MAERRNPRFPEGINASREHPLKEFSGLLIGLSGLVVIIILLLTVFFRVVSPFIPFSWEVKVTNVVEKHLSKDSNNTSSEIVEAEIALAQLVDALGESMVLPESIKFTVHLLESETPNAFATLGGHIFVTTGLIKTVNSENALSMVLAHEMAHIKYRHPIQSLGRGAVFSIVLAVVTGGQGGFGVERILGQSGLLTLLSFSRDMERESDQEAIVAVKNHYGHIYGADEFFKKMLKYANTQGWGGIFQTHPGIQDRIDVISSKQSTDSVQDLIPLDQRIMKIKLAQD